MREVPDRDENDPTLVDLSRFERLRLHDLPRELGDADLDTAHRCDTTSPCTFRFVIEKKATAELLRVHLASDGEHSGVGGPVELSVSGPSGEHTLSGTMASDFVHVRHSVELVPGTYSVTVAAREVRPSAPLVVRDFVWFGRGPDVEDLALDPRAMVVATDGPFYSSGPEYSVLAAEARAIELDDQLRPRFRFFGSEVFAVEGSHFALVRRDGTVKCPGAFHDYRQRYFVLDTRSGLLAFWHEASTPSLYLRKDRAVIRSETWDPAGEGILWNDLDLSGEEVADSTQIVADRLLASEDRSAGWERLAPARPEACGQASAEQVASFGRLVPESTQADLSGQLLACRVSEKVSFVTHSDVCWDEVNALVLQNGQKQERLDLDGLPSAVEVRKVHGRFLVFTWQADRGRIFEVTASGGLVLRFDDTAFGTRAAESCRCSA